MNKIRKCLSAALSTFMICSAVTCYGVSAADLASVSQGELARYIVMGGLLIALVGALLLLLSFKKPKEKLFDDELYDDEYDDNGQAYKLSEGTDENAQSVDEKNSGTASENAPDGEPDDSAEPEEAETADGGETPEDEEDSEDTSDAEDTEDAEGGSEDEEETEEESAPVEKVRLTLGGMNCDDVRIVEFSDKATIGRRSTNNVVISDNAVSGEHCRLTYSDGKITAEDMDSTNGTVVNGKKISVCEIKNGDVIILGKTKYKISFSIIKE